MAKRYRRPAPPGEFQDPLKNYEPPTYADELERSLCEQSVTAIRSQPVTVVAPDTSVERALEVLDGLDIGCLLVAEDDRLVGIFTERDVLDKVAVRYQELKEQPVREVMTPDPVVLYETDNPAAALCVMTAHGMRHVPVLDVNNQIVGVVSPKRITTFLQEHFETATS